MGRTLARAVSALALALAAGFAGGVGSAQAVPPPPPLPLVNSAVANGTNAAKPASEPSGADWALAFLVVGGALGAGLGLGALSARQIERDVQDRSSRR